MIANLMQMIDLAEEDLALSDLVMASAVQASSVQASAVQAAQAAQASALPLAAEAREPPFNQAFLAAATGRVLHVLIVDDVAMNRDIAGYFLRTAGHRVICLDGGATAVAAVTTTDFDCVLMDVRMPEMDGLEATRRIRALPGGRGQVPIVALTALAFTEQVMECRKAGMNGHVSKPFDHDMLVDIVMRATSAGPHARNLWPKSMPVPMPAIPVGPLAGLELPIVTFRTFDRTVSSLAPKAATMYLQTIVSLCEAQLRMLNRGAAVAPTRGELAAAAHTLAASASMFGFERLTSIARQYQRAIETATSQAPALADALSATIRTTLHELQSRTAATIDS
jgi:CheY-like chemotaxis protein